jgi:hypothetical protein
MRRIYASCAWLLAAGLLAGCSEGHGMSMPLHLPPADSVVLQLDGKAFQAGCADAQPSGGGFLQGATCGTGGSGVGPTFQSLSCHNLPNQDPPVYFVGAFFHGVDRASGLAASTTFDLADPAHEQSVTVMMNYMDETRTEYHYCTAPPPDGDATAYPASSGTVTVHEFVFDPQTPGDYTSDVELTNVVVPSPNGGPAITILSAHLYFL